MTMKASPAVRNGRLLVIGDPAVEVAGSIARGRAEGRALRGMGRYAESRASRGMDHSLSLEATRERGVNRRHPRGNAEWPFREAAITACSAAFARRSRAPIPPKAAVGQRPPSARSAAL